MKLAKSLLLGSTTAFVAVAGANAADLPSKKAAPATYVKVCDAYGAGFYTIPGSDTCVRIYGRVRTDHTYVAAQDVYASNVIAPSSGANIIGGAYYMNLVNAPATATSSGFSPVAGAQVGLGNAFTAVYTNTTTNSTGSFSAGLTNAGGLPTGFVAANGVSKKATNNYGFEARAVLSFDARTPTAYGTVQSVAQLQMKRVTGVGSEVTTTSAGNTKGMGPQLEAAYIRFAGFTFGAARDNFAYMPSNFYGSNHWASFANGAKQIAYTAALGGGFTATVALQDNADTTAGGIAALGSVVSTAGFTSTAATVMSSTAGNGFLYGATYNDAVGVANGTMVGANYKSLPQINGRIDFDQSWGSISALGAVSRVGAVNTAATYDQAKTAWAVGAGAKINLPMIAAGDTLWLNGGVANGMTEYTINYTSFKSSAALRDVGGYVVNHPSWLITSTGIETLKSWNVAGQFQHFWTPNWRQNVVGTYGKVSGTTTSKALIWGQSGAFGDATVWNTGTQLAFIPAKDFEIGVEVLYARVSQDILRASGTTTNGQIGSTTYANNSSTNVVTTTAGSQTTVQSSTVTVAKVRESMGNWTGRLRLERNF